MNTIREYIREIFLGSITEETGGEVCYKTMTLNFKIFINIFFVKIFSEINL